MKQPTIMKWGRSWRYALLLPFFFVASCSDESLSLFFDVPVKSAEEKAAEDAAKAAEARAAAAKAAAERGESVVAEEEGERPEIEGILDWAEVSGMLPEDDMGEVDWSAALRDGVIRPRTHIPDQPDPKVLHFKWDFYFAGPDPESDAFFPHSDHTEWLACESCHPAIFPYRELGTDPEGRYSIVMDQVFEGEYCGKCHGVVAFSLDTCSRCHLQM